MPVISPGVDEHQMPIVVARLLMRCVTVELVPGTVQNEDPGRRRRLPAPPAD
jgi:hypothetical protein